MGGGRATRRGPRARSAQALRVGGGQPVMLARSALTATFAHVPQALAHCLWMFSARRAARATPRLAARGAAGLGITGVVQTRRARSGDDTKPALLATGGTLHNSPLCQCPTAPKHCRARCPAGLASLHCAKRLALRECPRGATPAHPRRSDGAGLAGARHVTRAAHNG